MLRVAVVLCLACVALSAKAQVDGEIVSEDTVHLQDSQAQPASRSPARASLLSAVLPGSGQIYNKKYWKLPIVYAGLGTSVFFILDNRRQYLRFREAYLLDLDTNTPSSIYAEQGITVNQLRAAADQYRLWMEWSYIATGIVYVLQIVDAAVDAHLYSFNVSDDLTLNWRPEVYATRRRAMTAGITLSLNF